MVFQRNVSHCYLPSYDAVLQTVMSVMCEHCRRKYYLTFRALSREQADVSVELRHLPAKLVTVTHLSQCREGAEAS